MRLYELYLQEADKEADFEPNDPLRVSVTSVLGDIKAGIKDTDYRGEYKISSLLNRLRDNGVKMSKSDLIKVIKQEPWKNFISNIKGDHVVFLGEPDDGSANTEPDTSQDTMTKMADRAGKKAANPLA